MELLRIQQRSFAGIIEPYNPNVRMVGAENRGGVTCYLDALLFAMYAKLDHYEPMLKTEVANENVQNLAAFLRLWVNMLRLGKMIHVDLTELIQDALAKCGWEEARFVEQQDTSEAFAFITDQLQLPLLSLQVDMYHQGKTDKDDHKVVQERLLNLAVPPDVDGKGIKLEDCLEEYFNTRVEILRDSLEEKVPQATTLSPEDTIRLVTADEEAGASDPRINAARIQHSQLQRALSAMEMSPQTRTNSPSGIRPAPRHRATSIIQRIIVDEQGKPDEASASTADSEALTQRAKQTGSTVVKAVTIPSWMFSRLIPWQHSGANSEPTSDADVARQFNQRPVVGICLKRYTMTDNYVPIRHNTYIDIPDTLRLPHFMIVDEQRVERERYGLSSEFKLVLQSVVCHRGTSLHTGHYVSFARVAPKLLTENRRHDPDPPPDYEEAQWVRFDDLMEPEERVTYVDDIREALRQEMPYLLFYQILPVVDITATSTDGSVAEPPSYDDTRAYETVPQTPMLESDATDALDAISRSTSGYFDTLPLSNGPSLRLSSDMGDRPVRLSFDDDPYSSGSFLNVNNSRRHSVTFSESALATPAVTPDPSASVTPADDAPSTRLSRAAARFTKKDKESKSRPTSQGGEGRISITISRLGTLMRSSKEPLRDATEPEEDIVIVGEEAATEETNGKIKENGKEHHYHLHRKERSKAKKEKGKSRDGSDIEAERECLIM